MAVNIQIGDSITTKNIQVGDSVTTKNIQVDDSILTSDIIIDSVIGNIVAVQPPILTMNMSLLTPTLSIVSGGGWATGNALDFDGVNDYVILGSVISITGAFTFSCWARFDNFSNNPVIIGRNAGSGNWIQPHADKGGFFVRFNNSSSASFDTPVMSTSTWYHLMVTRDGSGNGKLYLNGTESTSGTQSLNTNTATFEYIGDYLGNSSFSLNGRLDDVAIWDGTVGTSGNASSLYNSGTPVDPESVIASATHLYYFNGSGTDTTLTDENGGVNGTLTNFPSSGMWVAR